MKTINKELEIKVLDKNDNLYFYSGASNHYIAKYDKNNYLDFDSKISANLEEIKAIISYIEELEE